MGRLSYNDRKRALQNKYLRAWKQSTLSCFMVVTLWSSNFSNLVTSPFMISEKIEEKKTGLGFYLQW